jgi:hypothetical protein
MKVKEPHVYLDIVEYNREFSEISQIDIMIENIEDYMFFFEWYRNDRHIRKTLIIGKYIIENVTIQKMNDNVAELTGRVIYDSSISYVISKYIKNEVCLTIEQLSKAVSLYSGKYMDNMILELPDECFNERLLNVLENNPNNISSKIKNWAYMKIKLNLENYEQFCEARYTKRYNKGYKFAEFDFS